MPWEQRVIHLLELAIVHNRSAHGQNLRIIDDVVSPWIKKLRRVISLSLGWAIGYERMPSLED